MERLVQANVFRPSRMFNHDIGDVYTRVETLMKGPVGSPLNALRQAWFGEHAQRLIVARYDSLTERPVHSISQLYKLLGEAPFEHDFNHVEYAEEGFDEWVGLPGMHTVAPCVVPRRRQTILPPDIFSRYEDCFWEMPGGNPRRVTVI